MTKLRDANERAIAAGKDPLLQRGAIVKSGRSTYRVESVRGSTVTVSIMVPWHKVIARAAAILSARIRRRFRPSRPAPAKEFNVHRPAAGDVLKVKK